MISEAEKYFNSTKEAELDLDILKHLSSVNEFRIENLKNIENGKLSEDSWYFLYEKFGDKLYTILNYSIENIINNFHTRYMTNPINLERINNYMKRIESIDTSSFYEKLRISDTGGYFITQSPMSFDVYKTFPLEKILRVSHNKIIDCVCVKGEMVLFSDCNSDIHLYNIITNQIDKSLTGNRSRYVSLDFNSDMTGFIAVNTTGFLEIWKLDGNPPTINGTTFSLYKTISGVSISEDRFLTTDNYKKINLWNGMETIKSICTGPRLTKITVSMCKKFFLSIDDKEIIIFNSETLELVQKLDIICNDAYLLNENTILYITPKGIFIKNIYSGRTIKSHETEISTVSVSKTHVVFGSKVKVFVMQI